MALGMGLRARGHSIVVATSSFYRKHIEAAGLDFSPVRPDMDFNDLANVKGALDPYRTCR